MNPAAPIPSPALTPDTHTLRWDSEADTQAFASRLALALQTLDGNGFIALDGALGAGKTTLVRHLLQALGVSGRIKSPTYAVVESYELPGFTAWHLDFYRFNDPQEFEDAGLREVFAGPGLKLAEWPDKAGQHLPVADWEISLCSEGETRRRVELRTRTPHGTQLWAAFCGA